VQAEFHRDPLRDVPGRCLEFRAKAQSSQSLRLREM